MLGVLGDLVQDVVVWQHEDVRPGTDTACDVFTTRGGSAANVAAFAAPRYPTRFIGCVGEDLGGWVCGRALSDGGVDVRLQTRGATGTIVVMVDARGERTMFPSRGASALLQTVDPAWLDDLEWLHLTAYSFESGTTPDAALAAADRVRGAGGAVCLDASSTGLIAHRGRDEFLALMRRVGPSVISANADETRALELADGPTPGPGLAHFPDAVVLARAGAAGTHVFERGRWLGHVPVEPVATVRDLTGAGDAFNAGYLTDQLAHGSDPLRGVRAGHALARSVLTSPGATGEAPPLR